MLNRKAVALLSGGLDSMLAIKIVQKQGIEVEALSFKTQFNCCKDEAGRASRELGVPVTLLATDQEYLKLVEKPKYGWGRGINPCVDCRIYMFRLAAKFMEKVGASFVITGEVVGQRPMSQMKHQMAVIERDSGLNDILVRPLSAKRLDPTLPEREGILDREKLYGISGRSRKELIDLAHAFNLEWIPTPSNGCLLTEPDYAVRVRDMFAYQDGYDQWDFDVLKSGRHFRLSDRAKVVIGKDQEENWRLETMQQQGRSVYFHPENFKGPDALLVGEFTDELRDQVGHLILLHTKANKLHPEIPPQISYTINGAKQYFQPGLLVTAGNFQALGNSGSGGKTES
ncbi:MAG: 7-cyano-7-deazaguanine synthase [Candidatus Omnitrophica bacterium]|nr:7-cyano-7-deazaguanine synthase [Candidatus Omnitrophota bacterium]